MDLFTHYVLKDKATGDEYIEPFANQVHSIVATREEIAERGGLTFDQAVRQISIWNRSQTVFRQEFTYRLYRI